MTPELEREIRDYVDRCADEPDDGYPPIEWGDLRGLLAALDAERAEVARLWHNYPVCADHMAEVVDGIVEGGHCYCCERDQARRDAVWAYRLHGAVPDSVGLRIADWGAEEDAEGVCEDDRVAALQEARAANAAYREELDGKS